MFIYFRQNIIFLILDKSDGASNFCCCWNNLQVNWLLLSPKEPWLYRFPNFKKPKLVTSLLWLPAWQDCNSFLATFVTRHLIFTFKCSSAFGKTSLKVLIHQCYKFVRMPDLPLLLKTWIGYCLCSDAICQWVCLVRTRVLYYFNTVSLSLVFICFKCLRML